MIGNGSVSTTEMHIDAARASGALAFFGDKYGEQVRVVEVGDYSRELCGGTHVPTTGQTGPVVVLGESSIGANLRRVEALTGETAYEHLLEVRDALDRTGRRLTVPWTAVPDRVEALVARVSELEDELEEMRTTRRGDLAAELAGGARVCNDFKLVVSAQEGLDARQLRQLALGVRERIGPGVVIVGSVSKGKGAVVGAVSSVLVRQGLSAAEVVGSAARVMGGGSSRDPELSQGGGPRGVNSWTRRWRRPAPGPPGPWRRSELGRVLAVDPGERRVGVALSDPGGVIAQPWAVIDRSVSDVVAEVGRMVRENQVDTIVVGLPVSLSGREGASAAAARDLAARLGRPPAWPWSFTTSATAPCRPSGS